MSNFDLYMLFCLALSLVTVLLVSMMFVLAATLINIWRLPRFLRTSLMAIRLYWPDPHRHYNWKFAWHTAKKLTEE